MCLSLPARLFALLLVIAGDVAVASTPAVVKSKSPKTSAEILAAAGPSDWRPLSPANTLYLELASGRVIIELAPSFAPRHVANIKALVREGYFDGLAIIRTQDNYVVQWGDPDGKRPIRKAKRTLAAEFDVPLAKAPPFIPLPDPDTYAPEVGFADDLPAAKSAKEGRMWLAHCYAMVGAGRDDDADSGGGSELYVVIGHAPRHLDRNVTLVGRVVQGMELLSTLPRGTDAMGFYKDAKEYVPIRSVRVAADVPPAQQTPLEVLRTDTKTFAALVEARRFRKESWFKFSSGHVDLCNVPLPVRTPPKTRKTQ